ncbi:S-layer homology domain-containing protein [Paenibacillus agri]|uniref:S-layer homology domain-containing protein n=1 Tax=Paenibacillus agri TaxID=2744309 RepID=A0A850EQG7_9BACL|nr:S-layer homology domain-containing protein [Paenibacillus agri]NUU63195.1 S-layer homology domain-containing protein [Paenibacillus agri]
MSRQKRLKRRVKPYSAKAVSAVLAGVMVLGGTGAAFADSSASTTANPPANQSNVSAPSTFSDVKTGFWAEKHIYKLAGQGIIVGNNGLFRPGDPVTQQEAVLMALRFMKQAGNADPNTQTVLPTGFEVSNYYKSYVIYALQQGLLDKTAEMTADNQKTSWGERKASREWIAELLIRSLGKSADAVASGNASTGFADDAKVSANKRGYINLAVSLGLANGLDGNRFDPQGAVTRAQLATFFSRAEAQSGLVYDNTVEGYISDLKSDRLSVYDNGNTSVHGLNASTAYFTSTSENRINLSDLQPYTKVTVIGATYNASYVEITDPTQLIESLSGNFAMVAPGNKLWLKSATGFTEYYYDDTTTFLDASGNKIEPSALVADSVVTLTRETYSGSHKVVKVQVTSGVINKTTTGTIQSVNLTDKSITFKNAAGVPETFKWEDGNSLFSSQNSVLQPADLKVGAAVKYTIQENVIRSLEVTEGVERTVQGMLNEITGTTVVYKKKDGGREVKLLAAKPAIVIPGIANPSSDDLVADATGGDNIQLTLGSDDQVTKIEVLSRQIDQFSGAAIVDYNSKTQLLTIKDVSGKPHVIQLDDKTKLAYDGIAPNLTTVGARLTEGRKINLKALGMRALSLELLTKYEGTLTAVNTSARTMVIKVNAGESLTLPYPNSVEQFGNSNATITDVPIGSSVIAALGTNQDIISVLKVKSVLQLETSMVNSGTNRIAIKVNGGSSEINTTQLPLTNEAGQTAKLTEMKAGDFVNVTFEGSTPLAIQTVKLTTGPVNGVDATAGTLTVKDYSGAVQTFNTSSGIKITRDGTTTTTLGSLTTADRIEARKDANGSIIVRVLTQASRIFSRYESASNEIVVKRDNMNDNSNRFRLAPNAYIHQGDTTLSVQSLKENDKIIMYFNNDVAIEVVKQ